MNELNNLIETELNQILKRHTHNLENLEQLDEFVKQIIYEKKQYLKITEDTINLLRGYQQDIQKQMDLEEKSGSRIIQSEKNFLDFNYTNKSNNDAITDIFFDGLDEN